MAKEFFLPFNQPIESIFKQYKTQEKGLSEAEVNDRLKQYGPNKLTSRKADPSWKRFLKQFHNVLIYVLIASSLISFLMQHYVDSGVILAVVVLNALVGFIQEGKAVAALQSILSMALSSCLVVRDGNKRSVDSTELVPGDIIYIQAGDKVPADLRLFYSKELRCDEAPLTGESEPVAKSTNSLDETTPLAERYNMAFMGTMVTYGVGKGVVCATGSQTEIGQINTLVQQTAITHTPLQKQLDRFGKQLSLGIVILAGVAMALGMWRHGYEFKEMFQAAIGIAVSAIPEGLPAIVTIALSIGVQRMAKNNAIIRRLPSVEVLGSVDVICSDKTGTLTTNVMTCRELVVEHDTFSVTGETYSPDGQIVKVENDPVVDRACLAAILCNEAHISLEENEWILHGDPTEGALLALAMKHGLTQEKAVEKWPKIDELPFVTEKRYMATMHSDPSGGYYAFIKGAPDRILECCTHQLEKEDVTEVNQAYWANKTEQLAKKGMRVMALAQKKFPGPIETMTPQLVEKELVLIALAGISDPPRKEAIASINSCREAGIRVIMITGDNPVTAQAIGQELGLNASKVMTGTELDTLSPAELNQAMRDADLFARTSPANKLQLVHALQSTGHVVAMTGDGVNDAPALKKADIGVAMAKKGTDAAKESSDMALVDDNFATIVSAIKEGRTVYDNIVKSILFILPTSLAEASVIFFAVIAGRVLPITPAQVLWVNMVTTVTLAMALAFEPPESNLMQRRPRNKNQGFITKKLMLRIVIVGALSAGIIFSLFSYYRSIGASIELSRTIAVNALVIIEALYLFNCRKLNQSIFSKEIFVGIVPSLATVSAVIALQILFTYLPISQQIFGVSSLAVNDWKILLLSTVPILFIIELEKMVSNRFFRVRKG